MDVLDPIFVYSCLFLLSLFLLLKQVYKLRYINDFLRIKAVVTKSRWLTKEEIAEDNEVRHNIVLAFRYELDGIPYSYELRIFRYKQPYEGEYVDIIVDKNKKVFIGLGVDAHLSGLYGAVCFFICIALVLFMHIYLRYS